MKNKIRILLFSLFVLTFIIFVTNSNFNVFASSNQIEEINIEKTNAEISTDSIIVTLTVEETRKFKNYQASDFSNIGCISIKDLTNFTNEHVKRKITNRAINESMLINYDCYKRILKLGVPKTDKDGIYDLIEILNKMPIVYSASPNFIYSLCEVPNDAYYQQDLLWGLNGANGIDIENAWEFVTNNTIVVGVIDTGIHGTHPDLSTQLSTGILHYDATKGDDCLVGKEEVVDFFGHGTHVAGIIGAQCNNTIGISGVSKNIELVSLRVFDDYGYCVDGSIVEAINYAASQNIPILNLSLGDDDEDVGVRNAMANYSGLCVCAAGNGGYDEVGDDNDVTRFYPSDYSYNQSFSDRVISVGAIDINGRRTYFSNYGANTVSIYAPGQDILSTFPSNLCTMGYCDSSTHYAEGYHYKNGTSMAAPHVTGVAALMLSVNNTLTAAQLKTGILANADTITVSISEDNETTQTVKKLNAFKAVRDARYNLNETGDCITGINFVPGTTIEIPSIINGKTITGIGEGVFSNQTQLTSVTLPNTITSIGANAFAGCTNLTNINIPDSVTAIGAGAFSGCIALENIELTESITNISTNTFLGCTSLTSIHIPNGVTSIGASAFANCTNLSEVYFYSYTVPTIGNDAFLNDTITLYVPYSKQSEYATAFTGITSDITSISININFEFDGTNCGSINTYYGKAIELPTKPTQEGAECVGWKDDLGNKYKYNNINGIYWEYTENLTLQPIWAYVITLKWWEGRTTEILVEENCKIEIEAALTQQHKEFKGFYTQDKGQGDCYVNVELKQIGGYYYIIPVSTNMVWTQECSGILYAAWNHYVADCEITQISVGDDFLTPRTETIRSGLPIDIYANTPNGYNFLYWEINGEIYEELNIIYTFELHRSYLTGEVTIFNPNYTGSMINSDGYITLNFEKIPEPEPEQCVAEGTLITLADGRQVPVETLTGNEMLLVWNMRTGTFDVAPILFIDQDALATYKIINLQFSDGTQVKVISEHAFFDCNLNKYVYLREDAGKYIGHWFNKQTTDANGNLIWTKVQLTNVSITQEVTRAYSPVTYDHLCLYVNGMLSMPGGIDGLINIFEVDGETMQINQAKYLEDIATYGLFTYEEFYELYQVPEVMFEACGGQYLKVAIGKGLLDYERLGQLIERYAEFFA